jgi:hypothetical protein
MVCRPCRGPVPHPADDHLRGVHYVLVSTPGILKLDGTPYRNNLDDWLWLTKRAAKAARWLGYVPFDCIIDERNEAPRIYDDPPEDGLRVGQFARKVRLHSGSGVTVPDEDDVRPGIYFEGGISPRQPYRVVLIGEKTSLAEVLDPIARWKAAELLLPTGDISDTMIVDVARRATRDGRPLVVLYFSDFDPSGYHMPNAVARKLQAARDLLFPDLEIAGVYAVALTVEQCREHDLPESFLKETELRAGAWRARWGREQTEIDALAALRPDVLRDIANDALRPFFDDTLERRQRAMERRFEDVVRTWFSRPSSGTTIGAAAFREIEAAREEAEAAAKRLEAAQEQAARAIDKAMREAKLPDAPDEPPDPILPVCDAEPLFTTEDDWVTATRKLVDRKKLVDES